MDLEKRISQMLRSTVEGSNSGILAIINSLLDE
jgi:hypothetical protein